MTAHRLRPGAPLQWQEWDDGAIVYDPETGETHQLDAMASEALHALERTPLDAEALCDQLSQLADVPADETLGRYVNRLVKRCVALGLLEVS
jgi:PqqD family protein of HPr-rel-A system